MESVISSDDNDDAELHSVRENDFDKEIKEMKIQLSGFGFDEEDLSKEEMCNILTALNNSKSSVTEDKVVQKNMKESKEKSDGAVRVTLKRKHHNVRDRRLPWSVLPVTITQAERAQVLAVHIKLMSLHKYNQARLSLRFLAWPPPMHITEETCRVQPTRSTRSGRTAPIYTDFDDDDDTDYGVIKSKRRRIHMHDIKFNETHSNKVLSLKKKVSDETKKSLKEIKMIEVTSDDESNPETIPSSTNEFED